MPRLNSYEVTVERSVKRIYEVVAETEDQAKSQAWARDTEADVVGGGPSNTIWLKKATETVKMAATKLARPT